MKNVVPKTYPSNGKGGPEPIKTKMVSGAKSAPIEGSKSDKPTGSNLLHKSITGKGIPKSAKGI